MISPVVGDLFKGRKGKRDDSPLEPLDRDSLLSRIGGPRECAPPPQVQVPQAPPDPCLSYLRLDGPRPAQVRNWRGGPSGSSG